jgi:hypothetical protein
MIPLARLQGGGKKRYIQNRYADYEDDMFARHGHKIDMSSVPLPNLAQFEAKQT